MKTVPPVPSAGDILLQAAFPLALAFLLVAVCVFALRVPLVRIVRPGASASRRVGEPVAFFLAGGTIAAPALALLAIPCKLLAESLGLESSPQVLVQWFTSADSSISLKAAIAFSVVALSPVAEEILYRAVLWNCGLLWLKTRCRCADCKSTSAAAAVASALVFAAMHMLCILVSTSF